MIDCCVANLVSESEAKLSSSNIAEPDTPVLITGLVRVLFDKACDVDISTVVAVSILRVAEPEVAPPDRREQLQLRGMHPETERTAAGGS